MKVSIYENAYKTESKKSESFASVIKKIKEGEWQDAVFSFRAGKSKKEKTPAFTPSGLFEQKRRSNEITKHSGVICIDIDAKENTDKDLIEMRAELYADEYTHAGFISVSGRGLVLFVKITPSKHLASFHALSRYYLNKYKIIIDESGKDVSRLRFVSYDPEAYYNGASQKWTETENTKRSPPTNYKPVFVRDDIDFIISQIQRGGVDITTDYHDWVKLAFALATEFGEAGREKFHLISAQHPEYSREKADKKYTSCLKTNSGKVGIGSFFWLAKNAGLKTRTPKNEIIVNAAKTRRKQVGVSGGAQTPEKAKTDTYKFLSEIEKIPQKEAQNLVEQVFELKDNQLESGDSELSDVEVLTNFVTSLDLKFNEITDKIEYKGEDITDRDLNSIFLNAKIANAQSKFSKELFITILESDRIKKYNPFLEFFEKNKHIKPKGNIEKLLSAIVTEDNSYADYVGTYIHKWLVSIVASALDKYSLLTLVLIGEQGTQKTNFFRNLLPPELSRYYAESKLDKEKDDEILMTKRLIVMDDEFGGKSKKEANKFKDLSSKQTFTNRKPYGRFEEDRRRYAVLCGTSNEREILNDPTGNRRIIPVYIKDIDFDTYKSVDKKDLFMELYHEWRETGDAWMLTKEEIRILNENTEEFFESSPEADAILTYFEHGDDFMTTMEMIAHCESRMGGSQRLYFKKFGQILKKLKYKRVKKSGRYGYKVRLKQI